ncbi:MAG: tyrosine-type recombinase/integrase [Chloroflexota bacterium]|nr:tyrosine-type recombinase/integrase [Chloroflexota bacterium]
MRAGELWQDTGLVFTTLQGRPLGASHVVNGSFRRIPRTAGAPAGLRFHDRHSCASLLLAQGVAARTVMDVLGHSTLAMRTRSQHVGAELMGEAARAMDRALGS